MSHTAALYLSFFGGGLLSILLLGLAGCRAPAPNLSQETPSYKSALSESATLAHPPTPEAILRVEHLFQNYTPEELEKRVPEVYAQTVWFRDGFREINGLDALRTYLDHSASTLRDSRFDFAPAMISGNEAVLRWTMHLNLNRDPEDRWSRTIGLSHIRFDAEGKVLFQQDYWDPTDMLYYRIPVAKTLIHQVRKKL